MEEIKAIWPGWEVVGQLGSGSFGSVYEIQRTIRGRTEHAAVKVLTIPQNKSEIGELRADGYDDESITQYLADSLDKIESEYAMMADMKGHSNVVYCDDLRTEAHEDGFGWDIYIKMELLIPLKSALREDAVQEQTARLGMDMCGALELCEKMNVVHRDIKPENIFVSRDGTYKLGDFGIARTMEGTTGGTKTGTYDYMAPEVYNNRPYHNQADIYSLGLVMYWLLNERTIPFLPIGARPTPSIKAMARERRFSGEALPAPKNGSDALKAIVLKACAFDPKERYASAAEMRRDLRKLDTGAVFVPPVIPAASVEPVSGGDGTVNIFTGQQEKPAEPMEGTVNLFSGHMAQEKTEYIKEEKTEYIREEKTEYIPRSAPIPEEKKKKKNWLFPVIAAVLVIAILLVMLRSCGDKPVGPGETTGSIPGTTQTEGTTAPTTGETTVPPTTEATEAPSVPTVPQQAEWSGWLDSLPEYVSNENYLIEELTLYRSREMEATTSTTQNTMDGWEHYDTVEADGGYGPWSDWSGTAVSATDSRQVETQQRYRYRNKEFTTGTSSAKNGWTLYNTTYAWSSYGSWSGWSTAKVTVSDSRKVETKTQYRYANKLTTSSTQSSMSGWTQSGSSTSWSDYGSWSEWSKWAVDASDSRQVESEYRYLYYCFICSNCGARIPYQSEDREGICHYELGGCGSTDYSADYQEKYLSNPPSDAKTWNLAYLGSKCLIVDGLRWYIDRDDDPIMTYRYRDRTQITTYYYWKWGTWSAWSDDVYSASAERRVETRTMYRYCDRTQIPTYHFWRWGSWSDWTATAVSGNDSRQVEKTTYYRYREYVTTTTYCFRRWKAWSDYSEIPVSPAETVEVETKTQYRFKSK